LLLALILSLIATAHAAPLISFKVPAGNLNDSLVEFSRQSNIPSIYAGNDATTIQTHSVFGELDPLEAMARMLQGQPLMFDVLGNPRSIVVRRIPAPIQEPPSSAGNEPTTQTPVLETVTVRANGVGLGAVQEVLIT